MKVCVRLLWSPETYAIAQGKARDMSMFQGPTQPAVRPKPPAAIEECRDCRGLWGSGQGLLSPRYLGRWQATPPPTNVAQEGCPVLSWANMCPRSFRKDATWRSCVATTYEDGVNWRMKNSIRPALLRSFGPVLFCPCCPRVWSLLSQHEGASQELINFPFQEDIFRELRHIRMHWNGAQWNFTSFKLRHTQADSESLLQVLALT